MAVNIQLKIDTTKIDAFLLGLPDKVLQKATAKALNKTMLVIRGVANRQIRDRLKLKVADVNRGLDIHQKASSSEHIDSQVVRMSVSSKPQSLMNFSPKQTPRGVRVNIKGNPKVVRHAFIATMPNGTTGVYMRRKYQHPGLPPKEGRKIDRLYTTSIANVFEDLRERFVSEGQRELNKQLKASFEFYYNKYLNS